METFEVVLKRFEFKTAKKIDGLSVIRPQSLRVSYLR